MVRSAEGRLEPKKNSDEKRPSKKSSSPLAPKRLLGHLGRGQPSSESALGHLGYGDRSRLGLLD